mgnify:CR=1 FL=1
MSFSKNKWSEYLYLKDQKFIIVIVLITLGASSYLGFITPHVIRELYDSYAKSDETFYKALWLLGSIFVGEYFISVIYQICTSRYVQKLLNHIRCKSFKGWILSIETAGKGQFGDSKYPMGEVLSRVLTDTEAVIEMVSTGSFRIFIDVTFIISCLIGFITLNTTSGIALIIAEVLVCGLLIYGGKQMGKVYMEVQKSIGVMSRTIANLSGGFRFTFFHPHGNYASKVGYDVFEDFLKKQLKANIWDASYFSIAESLFPILLALLVLIFPYSNITEIAVLAAIVDLIQRSIAPLKDITGKISSIQRARTGIVRIEEFNNDLKTLPKSKFKSLSQAMNISEMRLQVKYFAYPEKKGQDLFTLQDIDFVTRPGELVGIVGQSGCGKSTLLKILSADIVAEEASIDIMGDNLKNIHFSGKNVDDILRYKSQVSIVSQDSHVFSASLRFNISMSYQEQEGFDKFWTEVSDSIPYILTWGIKPDDIINVKELSLGQKQLLSALRSCYLAKPIVLFDEISSGLDSELEQGLRTLVLMTQKKSLTFIVAHRIETIIKANKIIVMDKGRVVADGKHDELMGSSAPYQDFISQLNKTH